MAYAVITPENERQKLLRWAEWAKANDVVDEYLVVLKTIHFRLSFEPLEWGEPRYTLHALGLTVFFGTFRMLNVWYGVDEDDCRVFVKLFQFRGDYPQGKPPDGKE